MILLRNMHRFYMFDEVLKMGSVKRLAGDDANSFEVPVYVRQLEQFDFRFKAGTTWFWAK